MVTRDYKSRRQQRVDARRAIKMEASSWWERLARRLTTSRRKPRKTLCGHHPAGAGWSRTLGDRQLADIDLARLA
jgi:hypothetical protein